MSLRSKYGHLRSKSETRDKAMTRPCQDHAWAHARTMLGRMPQPFDDPTMTMPGRKPGRCGDGAGIVQGWGRDGAGMVQGWCRDGAGMVQGWGGCRDGAGMVQGLGRHGAGMVRGWCRARGGCRDGAGMGQGWGRDCHDHGRVHARTSLHRGLKILVLRQSVVICGAAISSNVQHNNKDVWKRAEPIT